MMKKTASKFLLLFITVIMIVSSSFVVSAASSPSVTHNMPKTIKLGTDICDIDSVFHFHGLTPGKNVSCNAWDYKIYNLCFGCHAGDGPRKNIVDSQGNADSRKWDYGIKQIFYRPGTIEVQPSYCYVDDDFNCIGDTVNVGSKIKIVVEEPVIQSNLPQTVTVGTSLEFATALTNVNLKNEKVTEYSLEISHDKDTNYSESLRWDMKHDHCLAYYPIVEIIDGAKCVSQSNQDYTNTLSTKETLKFNQSGTVKIKITYHQINTCDCCFDNGKDIRYNPEKIITIKVTDKQTTTTSGTDTKVHDTTKTPDITESTETTQTPETTKKTEVTDTTESTEAFPVKSIDKNTGIKLETQTGVIPEGAVFGATEIKTGDSYVIVSNALKDTKKWSAFDLTLQKDGVTVQPNGKVKITVPCPSDIDKNNLVLYHISSNGELEKLKYSFDDTKENIVFEISHFSFYAIAESNETTAENKNEFPIWIIIVGTVIVLGGITAFIVLKKKKENIIE